MHTKEFGKTGKKVSVLGWGGMRFDPKDEEGAIRTVHRAVELGINYFDTAPGYCEDKSETFIGKALDLQPEDVRRIYKIYLAEDERWLKGKRASDCTQCGEYEEHCTQKLPIREYMKNIAEFLGEE